MSPPRANKRLRAAGPATGQTHLDREIRIPLGCGHAPKAELRKKRAHASLDDAGDDAGVVFHRDRKVHGLRKGGVLQFHGAELLAPDEH